MVEGRDAEVEEDEFIRYPVELERSLMEGSYDQVWRKTKGEGVPGEEFALFSDVSYLHALTWGIRFSRERCARLMLISCLFTDPHQHHPARDRLLRPALVPVALDIKREEPALPGLGGRGGGVCQAAGLGAGGGQDILSGPGGGQGCQWARGRSEGGH